LSTVARLGPWLALPALLCHGAAADAQSALNVPLECRIGDGPWSPCTMTIQRIGEHWWLQVGAQRLEFHSDGRGSISLRHGAGSQRAVQPVWREPRALCWDGICAKGDLPLD
jgi:hypothetical protein